MVNVQGSRLCGNVCPHCVTHSVWEVGTASLREVMFELRTNGWVGVSWEKERDKSDAVAGVSETREDGGCERNLGCLAWRRGEHGVGWCLREKQWLGHTEPFGLYSKGIGSHCRIQSKEVTWSDLYFGKVWQQEGHLLGTAGVACLNVSELELITGDDGIY